MGYVISFGAKAQRALEVLGPWPAMDPEDSVS